jgi:hypothetical protein
MDENEDVKTVEKDEEINEERKKRWGLSLFVSHSNCFIIL